MQIQREFISIMKESLFQLQVSFNFWTIIKLALASSTIITWYPLQVRNVKWFTSEENKNICSNTTFPLIWDMKICPITACWIVGGDMWRLKRKGIHNICINWTIKTMRLPIWRNCFSKNTNLSKYNSTNSTKSKMKQEAIIFNRI